MNVNLKNTNWPFIFKRQASSKMLQIFILMNKIEEKTVSFHTLGCRLNFSETGSIAKGFQDRGYKIVPFEKASDIVFLNTCTVTDGADSSCRNLIRKAKKNSPDSKVIVTGCYAQMESEKLTEMPEVDLILGNTEKYKVFEHIDHTDETAKIDLTTEFWGAYTTPSDFKHTRAFLKIQDGCNYICSFCIIPQARGRSRTISINDAHKNALELVESGYKEIVLTGVNIGEYEKGGEKLTDLVSKILEIKDLKRLRMSSVEPNTITKELLTTLKNSGKYQNHFHIPLQSADNKILKSMRRKYTIEEYEEILEMTQDFFPHCAIGADIITGYPGETEEQFQRTYNFLKSSKITHFHVFPFSKRQGTTAAKLEDHLPTQEKKRRVKKLNSLGNEKIQNYSEQFKGTTSEVLFEQQKNGFWEGYTPEFLRVRVKSEENLKNTIQSILISEAYTPEQHFMRGNIR